MKNSKCCGGLERSTRVAMTVMREARLRRKLWVGALDAGPERSLISFRFVGTGSPRTGALR